MRLRIEVVRQGLPAAKILWTATPETTASQLLEQIDNVFPLEAEDWGFEDYALQSRGYEVLHWMQLGQVLNDDDEVIIKPLQTNDIKARRVSGRHLITSDGRHLVDGVAFGRPLLRRPVRPDLYIPPRKRVRLTEYEEYDSDSDVGDDEDDAEIEHDNDISARTESRLGRLIDRILGPRVGEEDDEEQLQLEGPPEDTAAAGKTNAPSDELYRRIGRIENSKAQKRKKRVSFDTLLGHGDRKDDEHGDEDDDDDDFEPSSEESDDDQDMDDANMEDDLDNSARPEKSQFLSWDGLSSSALTPVPVTSHGRKDTQTGTAALDSDSTDTSSSDDDDDDDDDDDSSDSESDSSSSDQSSSPSEEGIGPPSQPRSAPFEGKATTRRRNARRRQSKQLKFLKDTGALPPNASTAQLIEWRQKNEKPSATKPQNQPSPSEPPQNQSVKGGQAAAAAADSDSDSDSDSTSDSDSSSSASSSSDEAEDLSLPELSTQPTKQKSTPKKPSVMDLSTDFEARRSALLAALADGGIDVQTPLSASPAQTPLQSGQQTLSVTSIDNLTETNTMPLTASAIAAAAIAAEQPRRTKLDVAASQRMLYGSLGVRRPRDEKDRLKLQSRLAEQAKRKTAAAPTAVTQAGDVESEDEASTDPNLWKKKINLSAVECVFDDVEYIRPSFPFKQRWDPQMRGKKRKRVSSAYTARKTAKTTDGEDYHESYDAEGGDALNYGDAEGYPDVQDYYYDNTYGHGHAEGQGNADESMAAEAQLLQETNTPSQHDPNLEDGDDLPSLPSDLSSLPILSLDNALPNAIITFTRLEVSAATQWTPSTPPVRVAQILAVYDDEGGKVLELQLAQRDIPKPQYDSSGRRIFSGFEINLDDDDDDDENEDGEGAGRREGVLEVALAEVLEGRVVVAAPPAPEEKGTLEKSEIDESEGQAGGAEDHVAEQTAHESPASTAAGATDVADQV